MCALWACSSGDGVQCMPHILCEKERQARRGELICTRDYVHGSEHIQRTLSARFFCSLENSTYTQRMCSYTHLCTYSRTPVPARLYTFRHTCVVTRMAAKGNTLSPEMQPKRAALEASNFESIFNYVPSFPGKPTFGSQGQKSPHN